MTQLKNDSKQPQTVSEMWPSKWLRAADLEQGKIVTITGQRIEILRQYHSQETEAKLILSFKNGTKELICTKTQAREIAALTGSETFADWPGTKVCLKPKLLPIGKYTIEVCPVPDNQITQDVIGTIAGKDELVTPEEEALQEWPLNDDKVAF